MRNFINILYRRILYKIPLKRLLVLLAVFAIGFASFSNAIVYHIDESVRSSFTLASNSGTGKTYSLSGYTILCFVSPTTKTEYYDYEGGNLIGSSNVMQCWFNNSSSEDSFSFYVKNTNTTTSNISYYRFPYNAIGQYFPACSQYTSQECQTEYNLIPLSSVDQNYCETNNLCSLYDCPEYNGSGYSNLYINNILHVGAPNIIMNIPEEIDWDYAYTTGGQNMNIDVVGYNVDYDYIDEQYQIQNYKPDSEDLTNIVSNVLPLFVPGLCIILLLYFIFRFIKKIF